MSEGRPLSPACDAELDAVGLDCPMPLLKAAGIESPAQRAVLKVVASDPGSQRDFRSFAKLAGHALLHEEVEDGLYRYWLRKA